MAVAPHPGENGGFPTPRCLRTDMTADRFVSPDHIRSLFSQAMSHMYRTEVPLYGTLVELVERINAQVLALEKLKRNLTEEISAA